MVERRRRPTFIGFLAFTRTLGKRKPIITLNIDGYPSDIRYVTENTYTHIDAERPRRVRRDASSPLEGRTPNEEEDYYVQDDRPQRNHRDARDAQGEKKHNTERERRDGGFDGSGESGRRARLVLVTFRWTMTMTLTTGSQPLLTGRTLGLTF